MLFRFSNGVETELTITDMMNVAKRYELICTEEYIAENSEALFGRELSDEEVSRAAALVCELKADGGMSENEAIEEIKSAF